MDVLGLPIFSSIFYKIQKSLLFPVIHTMYQVYQNYKDQIFKNTCCTLGICQDGRGDSPGYSVKCNTNSLQEYTLHKHMYLKKHKVGLGGLVSVKSF